MILSVVITEQFSEDGLTETIPQGEIYSKSLKINIENLKPCEGRSSPNTYVPSMMVLYVQPALSHLIISITTI